MVTSMKTTHGPIHSTTSSIFYFSYTTSNIPVHRWCISLGQPTDKYEQGWQNGVALGTDQTSGQHWLKPALILVNTG